MNRQRLIVLVLFLFSAWGVLRHVHNFGEDLASSYVGCRLLATGQGSHLYSHSATNFSDVDDPVWDDIGRQTGFHPLSMLHPYVQTPLWAYSLEPFCTTLDFRVFCNAFYVLFMLCMSGTIWLVARYWTPSLCTPLWITAVYSFLYLTEPFKYAIFLAQTHVLYVFLMVLALILAARDKAIWAGVLLALAAAVKITPGLLVIYWILTRRYKAALAFVGASALLALATVALLGPGLMHAYLASLSRNSNVLLLAFNNQSFAAWWVSLRAPKSEMLHWYIYHLPTSLKILMTLLTLASTVFGGWLDRTAPLANSPVKAGPAPYGAVFAIFGATIFAPIAWTHYFILLIIPMMFFLEAGRARKVWGWFALVALIFLLNRYPISFGSVHFVYKSFTVVRSQFYSGLLAMAGMVWLGWPHLRSVLPGSGQGQTTRVQREMVPSS